MKIERIKQLSGSRAVDIAMEGHNELRTRGWLDENSLGLGWNNKALLALLDDQPIGVLVYEETEWKRSLFVSLGYVREKYRGAGVYTALWNELIQIARETEFPRITGMTNCNNLRMQRLMEKLGRKQTYITYEYRITEKKDG